MEEPAETPVAIPVEEFMVATLVLLLVHAPPVITSVSAVVLPGPELHAEVVPLMV